MLQSFHIETQCMKLSALISLFSFMSQVEGCSSEESSCSPEVSPRKRLDSAEGERRSPRPPPEGAGSEKESTKSHLCSHCHIVVCELKRQALALTDPASLKVSLEDVQELWVPLLSPCVNSVTSTCIWWKKLVCGVSAEQDACHPLLLVVWRFSVK